jgi:hypothetical protein
VTIEKKSRLGCIYNKPQVIYSPTNEIPERNVLPQDAQDAQWIKKKYEKTLRHELGKKLKNWLHAIETLISSAPTICYYLRILKPLSLFPDFLPSSSIGIGQVRAGVILTQDIS